MQVENVENWRWVFVINPRCLCVVKNDDLVLFEDIGRSNQST